MIENVQSQGSQVPAEIVNHVAAYERSLGALSDYFAGVPAETARFTRDQDFLQQVREKSKQRMEAIHKLQKLLQAMR